MLFYNDDNNILKIFVLSRVQWVDHTFSIIKFLIKYELFSYFKNQTNLTNFWNGQDIL